MQNEPLSQRLASFEPMWTTEAHNYVLLRGRLGYVPLDTRDDMMILIDEDDELAAAVTERMLAAGVPVRG